jgi:hypothetical protein
VLILRFFLPDAVFRLLKIYENPTQILPFLTKVFATCRQPESIFLRFQAALARRQPEKKPADRFFQAAQAVLAIK